jgi:hypothetical protein
MRKRGWMLRQLLGIEVEADLKTQHLGYPLLDGKVVLLGLDLLGNIRLFLRIVYPMIMQELARLDLGLTYSLKTYLLLVGQVPLLLLTGM